MLWPLYFRAIFYKKSSSVTESHTVSHMSFINKIHDFFATGAHSCCCSVAMGCWDSIAIRFWRGKYSNIYRFYNPLPSSGQSLLSVSKSSTPGWHPFLCLNIAFAMKSGCCFLSNLQAYQKSSGRGDREMQPFSQVQSQPMGETIWGRFQEALGWNMLHHPPTEAKLKSTR